MHSLLSQLVAFASSLVLALPPGLCCGAMQFEPAKAAPAAKGCCQHAAEAPPADSKPTPPTPHIECCCERDLTLPEKSVKRADMTALALPVLVDDADSGLDSAVAAEAMEAPFRPGPRLHVVKCVWLC